jgi:hypothetical protein
MFLSGGEGAIAPQVTQGLCQGRDEPLQQAHGTECGGGAFECVVESVRVERFAGSHALFEKRNALRCFGGSARGASPELGRGGYQLAQLVRGQPRDLANAVARVGRVPQQLEPFDITLGIEPTFGGGPQWFDGAVALLPNPQDVGAQPGAPGDPLNGVPKFLHKFYKTYTNAGGRQANIPESAVARRISQVWKNICTNI